MTEAPRRRLADMGPAEGSSRPQEEPVIAGPDDRPPLFKVIMGRTTRDPTPAELPRILEYIETWTRDIGMPPLADHTVDGVGEVWFMRPPSPFVEP